jgi:hypothetical protein
MRTAPSDILAPSDSLAPEGGEGQGEGATTTPKAASDSLAPEGGEG